MYDCNTISIDKQLIGGWKMQKVYEGTKDVSSKHNPANDRWIMFNLLGFNSPMLASKVTLTEFFVRVICVHFGLSFLFCWHFRLD